MNFSGTTVIYNLIFEHFPMTLSQHIKGLSKNGGSLLPLMKIITFSKILINTLTYLQTMGVCHRDLKPQNIMIDEKCEKVFVIDFSESQEVLNYKTITFNESKVVGTASYLSPELYKVYKSGDAKDLKKLNFFKSDVFSFGLLLLKMGILKTPKRDGDEKIYKQNIDNLIEEFFEKFKNIAESEKLEKELEALREILKACLKVDSKDRPDFMRLYFTAMGMWSEEDNYDIKDEVQKCILIKENKNKI